MLAGCGSPVSEGSPGGASNGTDQTESTLPSDTALAEAFAAALESSGAPGGAILVSDASGVERLAFFGDARQGEPATAEDRFAYRSITKSFVGTVVLQLVEEGRVRLDAPVSEYVPGVPGGDSITIEQLGAMRSGLANYSALPEFGELLVADPAREAAADELLALAFAAPPVFEPGTAYEYSNTNTLLLAEVIESVTGDPWMTAVEQRILRPLELDSVAYGFSGGAHDALGYQLADGEVVEELPLVAPGWFGAAGGLTGDVRDLAVWARTLGSGSLLDAEVQQRRIASLGQIADDPASPLYDGYGFAVGELDGWLGHTGTGLGFQSLAMYDPATERAVAILVNGTGEDPDLPAEVFTELLELLAG